MNQCPASNPGRHRRPLFRCRGGTQIGHRVNYGAQDCSTVTSLRYGAKLYDNSVPRLILDAIADTLFRSRTRTAGC